MAGKCLFFIFAVLSDVMGLKLTQIVLLGRHNVRTPLTSNLERYTPKIWTKWKDDVGFLTAKGALLESYMGEYFSLWLKTQNLLKDCPEEDSVYIYANAPQRTRESARIFADAAFKDCNVKVHYKEDVTSDPVFNPAIHNATESFEKTVRNEMQNKLDYLQIKDAYSLLNNILDFNNSLMCKETGVCDLTLAKDKIFYKIGVEPDVVGPLNIGNSVVDSFLMAYYNGVPLQKIGWGAIEPEMWKTLVKITKENQNVRFNSTSLAKDVAKPLLNLINQVFLKEKHNFTLLVGHDSNINSVIAALNFKPFDLQDQLEKSPVGGKLVFQKWYDESLDRYLLKVNYVYQSTEQLRSGIKLSLNNPPKSIQLELKKCSVDENGFCPWNNFLSILKAFK